MARGVCEQARGARSYVGTTSAAPGFGPGPWYLVPGSWPLVPGTWFDWPLAPDPRYLVPGTRPLVPGLQSDALAPLQSPHNDSEDAAMHGLIMDYQLTLTAILRRAETLFARTAIVSRRPDKSLHRYTYTEFCIRARRLAVALRQLGIRPGDRVATLCWNHHQHLEAYFGIPGAGAVLHT